MFNSSLNFNHIHPISKVKLDKGQSQNIFSEIIPGESGVQIHFHQFSIRPDPYCNDIVQLCHDFNLRENASLSLSIHIRKFTKAEKFAAVAAAD